MDRIDVDLVELDVFVTDRRGRVVTDLSKEDFELYLDGMPVPILNFRESSLLGSRAPSEASPRNPAGTQRADANEPATSRSVTTVVLHLDEFNIHPPHRTRLLSQLDAALSPWRSTNARFMLTSFGTRLEILTSRASDVETVLEVASKRAHGSARAVQVAAARRQAVQDLAPGQRSDGAAPGASGRRAGLGPTCADVWPLKMAIARNYAAQSETRALASLQGLAELAGVLSGLEGRKVVFHVSDGLAQRPGMSVLSYLVEQVCPHDTELHAEARSEMLQYDLSDRIDRLAAEANVNRITFFPVDAAGVRTGLGQDMSFRSSASAPSSRNDFIHRMNVQNGLHLLAEGTGGSLLFNSNDLAELLNSAREHLSSSYSVGFRAPERESGGLHGITVLLAPGEARGRKLHYRRSYRRWSLEERLAARLMSATYLGSHENPLGARIRFGDTEPEGRGTVRLPVLLEVPEAALQGLADGSRGELRVWLVAVELRSGDRTTVRQRTLSVDGPDRLTLRQGRYVVRVVMKLPEGEYTVGAGLRNEATGATALLRESVVVPKVAG